MDELPEMGNPNIDQGVMAARDVGRVNAGYYVGARRGGAPPLVAGLMALLTVWADARAEVVEWYEE